MKNLSAFLAMFLLGWSVSIAAVTADDEINRGYNNSFIFLEGGIEFAVFPDGQFDFNYLERAPQIGINWRNQNGHFSFNSGFDYDRFVQYDIYGAVIQIENTPIFYDAFGRVQQVGNIFIGYRNGFVSRIGGLQIFYSRPGIVVNYVGFINNFNPYYVYQPWHDFYGVPVIDRRLVWQNPYRRHYNPIRYSWAFHNNYWNHPGYYNGRFLRASERRNFYRPNQRVAYNDFERGRRDSNGRAIAYNNRARSERESIATGRRDVTSYDNSRTVNGRSNANAISQRSSEVNRSNSYTRSSENVRSTNRSATTTPTRSSATTRSSSAIDSASSNRAVRSTINTTRATTPAVRSTVSNSRSTNNSAARSTTTTRSSGATPVSAGRSTTERATNSSSSRSARN
jgi:hypothetical protein